MTCFGAVSRLRSPKSLAPFCRLTFALRNPFWLIWINMVLGSWQDFSYLLYFNAWKEKSQWLKHARADTGGSILLFPLVALYASISTDNTSSHGSGLPNAISVSELTLRPLSHSQCSNNPVNIISEPLKPSLSWSSTLSSGMTLGPLHFYLLSSCSYLSPLPLLWFRAKLMGSHLVLIYETSLQALLPAFHSEFYELVEREGRREGAKSQEENKMWKK